MAVELVIESGALSTEHVLNVLARLNATPAPESVQNNLRLLETPVANTGRYDSLRSVGNSVVNNVININDEIDTLVEVTHAS